jgi:addiction module HigA family antidote
MKSLRAKHAKPTHPGAILREDILPELSITQGEFAKRLGVSRRTVNELINERRPITPDMAIRLSCLVGSTPATWLKMQQTVDLWEVDHTDIKQYANIKKLPLLSKLRAG